MGIKLPKESGDFEKVPAGSQTGVCHRIIDLGTQEVDYQGNKKHQRKVLFSWEIFGERTKEDEPFTISKRFTLSASKKSTMRAFLESWRGEAFTEEDFGNFDLGNLLGKGALLGIIHEAKDDKVYENITTIMKLPKGMTVTVPENEMVYFSLDDFDQAVFDKLSDNLKETIKKSPEYTTATTLPPAPEAAEAQAILGGTVGAPTHF